MNALYEHGVERAKNGAAFETLGPPAPELRTGNP
jgi:hypothetical protein